MTLGCQRCELYRNTGTAYLARLWPKHLQICPPYTDHRTTVTSQWWADFGEQGDNYLPWHQEGDLVLVVVALQNGCTLPEPLSRPLNLAAGNEILDMPSGYLTPEEWCIQFVGAFLLLQYCHSKKRMTGLWVVSGSLESKCGISRETTSFAQCPCFQGLPILLWIVLLHPREL